MSRPELAPRQSAVLDYLREHLAAKGYAPTLREIGAHLGIRSTNGVNDHLRALERKGYIVRDDMKSRAIVLVADPSVPPDAERPPPSSRRWPPAIPIFASLDPRIELTKVRRPSPFVRVEWGLVMQGSALDERGIFDGDWLFIENVVRPILSGKLVVVRISGIAVPRFVSTVPGLIRLASGRHPPAFMQPSHFNEGVLGVVAGIWRRRDPVS